LEERASAEGSRLASHSSLSTTARDLYLTKAVQNEREAVSLKRGKPKKVKLIDLRAPPDFSKRRVFRIRKLETTYDRIVSPKRDHRLCFLAVIGQTIPRAPSGYG